MILNAVHTIPSAVERAVEQITMIDLAEYTRKAYQYENRRFFDSIGEPACETGTEDVRGRMPGRTESGLSRESANMTAAGMRFLLRDALDCLATVKRLRSQRMPRMLPRRTEVKEIEQLALPVADIRAVRYLLQI